MTETILAEYKEKTARNCWQFRGFSTKYSVKSVPPKGYG